MITPPIPRNDDLDPPAVRQAPVDLAACLPIAAARDRHAGVCNHRSFMGPGCDDAFPVTPDGWPFATVTASRLPVRDLNRPVVPGFGAPAAAGRPVRPIAAIIAQCSAAQLHPCGTHDSAALHLASLNRHRDATTPEYRQ